MTGREPASPWWASGGPEGASHQDDDPLTAHRRARAGDVEEPPPTAAPSWWAPAAEAVARLSEDLATTAIDNADRARGDRPWHEATEPRPEDVPGSDRGAGEPREPGPDLGSDGAGPARDAAAHLDVCGVCPICVGLRALGTHHPELVGHLSEAARHLAAAVRTFVEAPEPRTSGTEGGTTARADDGLTRIDLDDLDLAANDADHDAADDADDPGGHPGVAPERDLGRERDGSAQDPHGGTWERW